MTYAYGILAVAGWIWTCIFGLWLLSGWRKMQKSEFAMQNEEKELTTETQRHGENRSS